MGLGYVPAGKVRQERQSDDVPRREHRGVGAHLRSLSARQLGRLGEQIAADFLVRRGAAIHKRNLRVGCGELDLLVSIDGERVAVEVKTSLASSIGDPGYRFGDSKQRQVRKLAANIGAYRVDFVGVEISSRGATVRWLPRIC